MELKCAVQNYDWGKRGKESVVARLVKNADKDFDVEEKQSYAELWMGTHPNGPSCLKDDGTRLKDHIDKNKHTLGTGSDGKVFEDLPFLFKVLSVGKALSIQAHPDKKRAERLHLQKPEIYKDPNHKPELAITLSRFEALCGFRPINEIKRYVEIIPEFREAIGSNRLENQTEIDHDSKTFLKSCLEGLLRQDHDVIAHQLNILAQRLSELDESTRDFLHADIFEKLYKNFPADVGCFAIYIFNVVTLEPNEAIYIAANEPHAYISGDCVECMACSDNVVRAGLTPKLKDVDTLTEMLTYNCEPAMSKLFKSVAEDHCTEVFRPPVPDFAVAKITITEKESYDLIPRSTASILLIVTGDVEISSKPFSSGSVLFLSANEKISLKILSLSVTMFQAFANVSD